MTCVNALLKVGYEPHLIRRAQRSIAGGKLDFVLEFVSYRINCQIAAAEEHKQLHGKYPVNLPAKILKLCVEFVSLVGELSRDHASAITYARFDTPSQSNDAKRNRRFKF